MPKVISITEVIQLLEISFPKLRGTINEKQPLFSSKSLDSFAVLELISAIEENYPIILDPCSLNISMFDTPECITHLINSKKG